MDKPALYSAVERISDHCKETPWNTIYLNNEEVHALNKFLKNYMFFPGRVEDDKTVIVQKDIPINTIEPITNINEPFIFKFVAIVAISVIACLIWGPK